MASTRLKLRVVIPVLVIFGTILIGLRWIWQSPLEVLPIVPDEETVKRTPVPEALLLSPFLYPGSVYIDGWASRGQTLTRNNDFVRLVGDRLGMIGLVFTDYPLRAQSFEILLTFHIHTTPKKKLVGDGMALWLLEAPPQSGTVFGIKDKFKGLGIMLDTFRNGHRGSFPYINVMLGDGQTLYSNELDGADTRLDGCMAPGTVNPPNKKSQLRILYLASSHLQIDFDANGDGKWKNCVTRMGVKLPLTKYLGLSAATGQLSHFVDILECRVNALRAPDGSFLVSQEEWETEVGSAQGSQRKNKPRKLTQRARSRERKVKKEAEARRFEKYGDPNMTFVRRVQKSAANGLVMTGMVVAFLAITWIGWLVLRTWKQGRKAAGGLLD